MNTVLETYELLGYKIELVDILEFLSYLEDEKEHFSALSYSSFLKSIFIPPKYFLEQPLNTQEQLLKNKKSYLNDHSIKYDKYCVVVWKENNQILNCARAVYEEAIANYEYISSISNISTSFVDRVFVRDGIVSLFNTQEIKNTGVNAGSVINVNMLLNKPSEVIKATCELPSKDTEIEANKFIYVDDTLDNSEYQHIELAVNDIKEDEIENSYNNLFKDLNKGTKYLTFEVDRILLELVKDKNLTESMAKKLAKYISKKQENLQDITKETLLNYILSFDASYRRIKEVNIIRNTPLNLVKVLERLNKKEDEK